MTEVALEELTDGRRAGRWELDSTASTARLTHKTLWGLVSVKGTFTGVSGNGATDADGALSGSIQIPVASLDTHHAKRDAHLRSADFFAADKYPTIDFTAVSAVIDGAQVKIEGVLEVRGIRELVSVTALVAEADADSVVLTVDTDIDRASFGMSWNRLGMMRGRASVSVKAVFHRSSTVGS